MPRSSPVRIVKRLTAAGLNADREAVTLLAGAADPDRAVSQVIDRMDEQAVTVTTADVRPVLENARDRRGETPVAGDAPGTDDTRASDTDDTR
ncbi:MAG: DNA polymerase II small subunit, partial [Halodesulfurarchaeum sp.]